MVSGVRIGAGDKVLLFLAAANRDPRHWADPDRFDLRRRAQGHVAFGFGIHACIGADPCGPAPGARPPLSR
jgi:4-methoxybenzoate monooxygenase (O-demethylating)